MCRVVLAVLVSVPTVAMAERVVLVQWAGGRAWAVSEALQEALQQEMPEIEVVRRRAPVRGRGGKEARVQRWKEAVARSVGAVWVVDGRLQGRGSIRVTVTTPEGGTVFKGRARLIKKGHAEALRKVARQLAEQLAHHLQNMDHEAVGESFAGAEHDPSTFGKSTDAGVGGAWRGSEQPVDASEGAGFAQASQQSAQVAPGSEAPHAFELEQRVSPESSGDPDGQLQLAIWIGNAGLRVVDKLDTRTPDGDLYAETPATVQLQVGAHLERGGWMVRAALNRSAATMHHAAFGRGLHSKTLRGDLLVGYVFELFGLRVPLHAGLGYGRQVTPVQEPLLVPSWARTQAQVGVGLSSGDLSRKGLVIRAAVAGVLWGRLQERPQTSGARSSVLGALAEVGIRYQVPRLFSASVGLFAELAVAAETLRLTHSGTGTRPSRSGQGNVGDARQSRQELAAGLNVGLLIGR